MVIEILTNEDRKRLFDRASVHRAELKARLESNVELIRNLEEGYSHLGYVAPLSAPLWKSEDILAYFENDETCTPDSSWTPFTPGAEAILDRKAYGKTYTNLIHATPLLTSGIVLPHPQLKPIGSCPANKVRVFAFLWAGGCAGFLQQAFQSHTPPWLEVCAVNLPGREEVTNLTIPATSWQSCIGQLVDVITQGWIYQMPCAFFGHSLGAWVQLQVYRELRRRGHPLPVHMFVTSKPAPHIPGVNDSISERKVSELPSDQMWDFHVRFGLDERAATSEAFRELYEPVFRGDMALAENYEWVDEPLLDCPVTTMMARGDPLIAQEELEAWRELSSSHDFECYLVDGGHTFFLEAQGREKLFAAFDTHLQQYACAELHVVE